MSNILAAFARMAGEPASNETAINRDDDQIRVDAERVERLVERKARRIEFGEALDLPECTTAIAARLSGLSDRSWGDGRNRRSVTHIMLMASYAKGRLRRESGQFLCDGKRRHWEVIGDEVPRKATCPKCLMLSRR